MPSEAWEFLSQYVKDAEKDAVQDALQETQVHSLQDLHETTNSQDFAIWLAGKQSNLAFVMGSSPFKGKLATAINLEDCLNQIGDFNFDTAGLPLHKVNEAVQPTTDLLTTRNKPRPPILVLGSSGSGKTTFAAKVLPRRLQSIYKQKRNITVYMTADVIRPERNEELDEVALLVSSVLCILRRKSERNIDTNGPKLDLFMTVIIDEVGLECDTAWMGSREKLTDLTVELQRIAMEVQLVLAGTGLDRVSSNVNSNQDCVKIRMQPWISADVEWVAKTCLTNVESAKRKKIFDYVSGTPILKALTTNARATWFLLEALQTYDEYFDDGALIDHAVTIVAFKYIKSNGLKDLDTTLRRRVAKRVLKALSESKNGQPYISLPQPKTPAEEKVQRASLSLLETNVEKGALLEGHDYAVSVTPAIAIVLTALMGCISTLSSSWSGFERISALSELQRCFVAFNEDSAPCLLRSPQSFPPTNFGKRLWVPTLEKNMVLINGSGAPYADVIGYRRLIQSKHTRRAGAAETLDIRSELKKLGVLKSEHYKDTEFIQNRFLTNRLIVLWEKCGGDGVSSSAASAAETNSDVMTGEVPPTGDQVKNSAHYVPNDQTRSMYPMGLLDFTEKPDRLGCVDYKLTDGEFYRMEKGKYSKVEWDRKNLFKDCSDDSFVTVVFSTNKDEFKLSIKVNGSNPTVDLKRQHLNDDGQIIPDNKSIPNSMNNAILAYLGELVDTNKVKIRFEVCTH